MSKKDRVFLLPLFLIVIANYVAQIPYGIHLYHGHYNLVGVFMLLVTLVWFVTGFVMLRTKVGYWLLMSFLAVEFLFYFHGEILMLFFGYGIYYHLIGVKDNILRGVFFVGDVNFVTAGYYLYYLLRKKPLLL